MNIISSMCMIYLLQYNIRQSDTHDLLFPACDSNNIAWCELDALLISTGRVAAYPKSLGAWEPPPRVALYHLVLSHPLTLLCLLS